MLIGLKFLIIFIDHVNVRLKLHVTYTFKKNEFTMCNKYGTNFLLKNRSRTMLPQTAIGKH